MEMFTAIRNSAVGLSIFAVITSGAIALTQVSTKDQIMVNEREARAKALYEIVPRESIDNNLLEDTYTVSAAELTGTDGPSDAFLARLGGQVITVILPVTAPDGYTGKINMIVGINADESIAGVRVLAHKETPGLGDKVELKKSDWVLNFNGQRYEGDKDPSWAVKKDGGRFDQFTGATITPRAVVNATARAIHYFREHKTALLENREKLTQQPAGAE
ncbi:electron transport complex subunit RsxG [Amphritea japonica]|uniref:Ion-translocating oxidoreductase complex subunit G n=1 Tax=Amphritea japonica ATCC BAA-1530 TaxID=1278309 RepID=A0A7R6PLA9_9GAMM|nr:electron transport complex subunit RsxG [Amphritea japonica]BBB25573.1 electron transport complex protein RnfG [Amphritea japonica ATCC BAA-1530]